MHKLFKTLRAIRFKRFTNKRYAAFCSLHKVVSIGCVSKSIADKEILKAGKSLALCTLLTAPAFALASDLDPAPADTLEGTLAEISVVAAVPTSFPSEYLRTVTTIEADNIFRQPAYQIHALLKAVPGLDLRERGLSGVQADLSIRGGTQDQTKVLLNGIDLTDPQSGHYSLDLPLPLEMVKQMDVLQGSVATLGAYSGAINLHTCPTLSSDTLSYLQASVRAGEYGIVAPTLWGGFQTPKFFLSAGANYNRSSGYQANTDYQMANAFLQLGNQDFLFMLGGQYKDAGANSFYSLAYPNQFDATRTLFSALTFQHRWGDWKVQANLYHRTHWDHYELFRSGLTQEGDPAPDWYTPNDHTTFTTGAELAGSWYHSFGELKAGIAIRDEAIRSSNLGNHNRLILRYYAVENFAVGHWSGSISASGNWNRAFGNDYALSFCLNYSPNTAWRIFADGERTFRLPTYTDLYYQSKTQEANPLLRAEKAWQAQLGFAFENSHWNASLSAYYRWGKDIIDWVQDPAASTSLWKSMNFTQVNAVGGEAKVSVGNYRYLQLVELTYAYTHLDKDAGTLLSKYALDYLEHKLSLRIDHRIYKGFAASWCLRLEKRHGDYLDLQGARQTYQPVLLLDGKIYWQHDRFNIFVQCTNMTNRHYYDYGGILQPPHCLTFGISATLL